MPSKWRFLAKWRAAASSIATWPSWPHACILPAFLLACAKVLNSCMGRASMSARRPTARCDVPFLTMPTTPVPPRPRCTGMPHSVSLAATTSAVRTSWKHSSGWAWMSRRTATMDAASVKMESRSFMVLGGSCREPASLAACKSRAYEGNSVTMPGMAVSASAPRALEFARTLVGCNTVSANTNLPLIHCSRDELSRLGVKSRLSYNADKTKANLFATLGEGKPAGLILSGHTDTVPWDGQDWSVDPLGGVVRDQRLYGRGSADMKGFIATAVAHAQLFLESDAPFAIH